MTSFQKPQKPPGAATVDTGYIDAGYTDTGYMDAGYMDAGYIVDGMVQAVGTQVHR